MAKMKRVSVNEFENMVKDLGNNFEEVEYNGLNFIITNTISLKDMLSLVAEVAENCFMEDGRFMPEVMQPLLDCGVVERYTNITLPKNLEYRYELVSKSGVLDFIMTKINTNQYNDIVLAVRDKLEYMSDVNIDRVKRTIDSMVDSLTSIQESVGSLFDGVTREDIMAVIGSTSNATSVEENIMRRYISSDAIKNMKTGDM